MITDRIGLHSVLLPLLIVWMRMELMLPSTSDVWRFPQKASAIWKNIYAVDDCENYCHNILSHFVPVQNCFELKETSQY